MRSLWLRGSYAGRIDAPFSTVGPYDPTYAFSGAALTQTHCHTTASDGSHTPVTLVEYYLEAGYDALAITDHNEVTTQPAGITTPIPGNELSSSQQHIISIGTLYDTGSSVAQTILDGIYSAGGKAHIAHPVWSNGMTYAEMAVLSRYMGLEIHNGHCITGLGANPVSFPAYAVSRWDELLTNVDTGIFGFAVDDLHKVGQFETYDIGRLRTFVNDTSPASILTALGAGHFVADVSNHGVTPGFPERTDEGVALTCTGATRIDAFGIGGSLLQRADADNIEYVYTGLERYVRLVAYGDFTEPFDAVSDRWYGTAIWTVAGGELAISTNATASRYTLRKHREGDFAAQVDTKLSNIGSTDSGALLFNVLSVDYYMMARIGGSSTPGYNNTFTLSYTTNDAPTAATLIDSVAFDPDPDVWYTIKVEGEASTGTYRAKVWETGDTEPDWMIEGVYTGWHHGAFALRANRQVRFDNFYADGFQTFYQPIAVEFAA